MPGLFTKDECTAVVHANTETKQCYWDGWGCCSKEAYFIAKWAEACPSEDISARAKAVGFANMESLFDDVGMTPSGYDSLLYLLQTRQCVSTFYLLCVSRVPLCVVLPTLSFLLNPPCVGEVENGQNEYNPRKQSRPDAK
jgi:hypothetical protein